MEQQIRFCTTSDGVRIAYATIGEGPPLVAVSLFFGHLQFEWNDPDVSAFWQALAKGRLVVRYDKRGTGLSDWDVADLSLEARVRDLETVVEALDLKRCDLLGISEGGPTSIVYAARRPESVNRLILYGSYPRLFTSPTFGEPLRALVRSQWGMGSAALASVFAGSSDPVKLAAFIELQRVAASGDTVARILEEISRLDVTPLLSQVRAPTLVVHRNRDPLHPFDLAREMAATIPDARLEALDGDAYPPWLGDSASILRAIRQFLGDEEETEEPAESAASAPSGLVTILFTDMEGSTALTQRLGDAKAQEVLRAHNAVIRDALKAHSGSEVKHTGDGIMASFGSAARALECAVAVQRAFGGERGVGARPRNEVPSAAVGSVTESSAEPATPTDASPLHPDDESRLATHAIRVRIGVNAGEPVAEDGDLFGSTVQLAARVCAKAEPGQILAANVVRELAMGKGFLFADLGDFIPKGFEDPVRLYEVRWRENPA